MTRVDPRTVPVRYSALKQIAQSPAHYEQAVQYEDNDSMARRLGRGVHALMLSQPCVTYTGKVRRGREWDAFKAEHAGAEILSAKEHAWSSRVVDSIMACQDARDLLLNGATLEQQIAWRWMGRACTSRPDSYAPDRVVDLKTHRAMTPERFVSAGSRMAYHGQLDFYREALISTGLAKNPDCYIVAVETSPPFPVTVFRLTTRALEQGRKQWRLWFEQLLNCEHSNQWPPYAQSVIPFDVEEPTELIFSENDTPDPDWVSGGDINSDESEAA